MLNRTDYREKHPEDGVLLAYLDREQPNRQQAAVRLHLESCWTCRARLATLEDTISAFVDFRGQVFSADSLQPPHDFSPFSVGLAKVKDEPANQRFWTAAGVAVRRLGATVSALRQPGAWPKAVAAVTVMLAIVVASSLIERSNEVVPSGNSLLAQSAWTEKIDQGQLMRRTLIVEQKDMTTGRVVQRRRIESWKSGSGLRARRVYDENNAMVSASWIQSDGSRVQYEPSRGKPVNRDQTLADGTSIWELSASASDFARLVGTDAALTVEVTPAAYIVDYSTGNTPVRPYIRSASLALRRGDLHPLEQVFVLEGYSTLNQYRISEIDYERRKLETADARYFQPDALAYASPASVEPPPPPLSVPATLDQEVQVFGALDSVGALVGEQIDISFLASGALTVHGLAPTTERRDEIVAALGGLGRSPAVKVEISTVDEAQRRDSGAEPPPHIRLDHIEIARTHSPAEPDLRAYLIKTGIAGENVAEQVYRISTATLHHASASREHSIALQRIAASFTPTEVAGMSDQARSQWVALVHRHALGLTQNLRQLREDVGPTFAAPPPRSNQIRGRQRERFWDTARQLDEMASLIDDYVRRSFTVRAQESSSVQVRQQEFWDAVDGAIALADSLRFEVSE